MRIWLWCLLKYIRFDLSKTKKNIFIAISLNIKTVDIGKAMSIELSTLNNKCLQCCLFIDKKITIGISLKCYRYGTTCLQRGKRVAFSIKSGDGAWDQPWRRSSRLDQNDDVWLVSDAGCGSADRTSIFKCVAKAPATRRMRAAPMLWLPRRGPACRAPPFVLLYFRC